MPSLPSLEPSDIPELLKQHPIGVRNKSDAPWYLLPAVCVAWLLVTLSSKSAKNFWMGVPGVFGKAYLLTPEPVDPETVESGEMEISDLPVVVHELTHCMRWIELGFVRSVLAYVLIPLPIGYTGRSTEEFMAECNEMLCIKKTFGFIRSGDVDEREELIRASAKTFTSLTYFWPTFDEEGWRNGLRAFLQYHRYESHIDALDAVGRYKVHEKFGGYLAGDR